MFRGFGMGLELFIDSGMCPAGCWETKSGNRIWLAGGWGWGMGSDGEREREGRRNLPGDSGTERAADDEQTVSVLAALNAAQFGPIFE